MSLGLSVDRPVGCLAKSGGNFNVMKSVASTISLRITTLNRFATVDNRAINCRKISLYPSSLTEKRIALAIADITREITQINKINNLIFTKQVL